MKKILDGAWKQLSSCAARLDQLEKKVRATLERPTPQGRETPFYGSQSFTFPLSNFTPVAFPLVHSAGRVTRVVRVSYSVDIEYLADTDPELPGRDTPLVLRQPMRPNPRVMVGAPRVIGNTGRWLALFDFEWNMSVGSTERQYAQARGLDNRLFMARSSLGDPENDRQMLFTEKHPLLLKTNEFLTFTVKPIFNYFDPVGGAASLVLGPPAPQFIVNITYAGWRTFGYE